VAQAMNLVDGDTVNQAVSASGNIIDRVLGRPEWDDSRRIEEIYLTALSRHPTSEESAGITKHLANASGESLKKVYQDLLWAILNSKEFAYIH